MSVRPSVRASDDLSEHWNFLLTVLTCAPWYSEVAGFTDAELDYYHAHKIRNGAKLESVITKLQIKLQNTNLLRLRGAPEA